MSKRKNLSKTGDNLLSEASRRSAAKGRGKDGGGHWLYGIHAVLAALANPRRRCRRLVVTAQAADEFEARLRDAMDKSEAARPTSEIRERRDIENLLPNGAVHQGMALLADELPGTTLEWFCRESGETAVIILDQATDPRNVGAVMRSAAAFGVGAIIVHDRRSPTATGALAKAASGALEKVALIRVSNITRAMNVLKDAGFWCAGLDAAATTTLAKAGLSGRIALVLGSEGGGLRRLTRENCDLLVRVPMTNEVESLNLSNAAAIALYELARERP